MVNATEQQPGLHRVRLYDLGNTLIRMDHAPYVFEREPSLRAWYKSGDPQANLFYEQMLEEGLRRGEVRVSVLPGVAERLAADQERGLQNAVFSTCTISSIEAALCQLELSPYVCQAFSTFDSNDDSALIAQQSAAMKTAKGFQRVNTALQGRITSYADDKIEELVRARQGLGSRAVLYWIKNQDAKQDAIDHCLVQEYGITGVVESVADICAEAGLRTALEMPFERIGDVV